MLHRFSVLVAASTFFLLVAGAMVTSTGSGLAVPDWPLSFGKFFPPMVGGVLYEHGHRMIAAAVGFLTLLLALVMIWKEPRSWVRRMAIAALAAVCLQGLLGGLTVLWKLPAPVSIAHAGLAELFFALTVSMAVVTSQRWEQPAEFTLEPKDASACRVLAVTACLAVFLQILLGALVRHTDWKAAVFVHMAWALAALFFVGRLSFFLNSGYADRPALRRPAMAATHLLALQLILGTATWIAKVKSAGTVPPLPAKVWLASFHLALGALLFGICVALTWRVFKFSPETRATTVAA